MTGLAFFLTFRSSDLITTFTCFLMDNFCPCFIYSQRRNFVCENCLVKKKYNFLPILQHLSLFIKSVESKGKLIDIAKSKKGVTTVAIEIDRRKIYIVTNKIKKQIDI